MDARTKLKRLKINSNRLLNSFFAGDYRSFFKGPGLEFHETRPYVIGDDVRFIDWNVSSRMNAPFCKVFREERELLLTIIFDVSASITGSFSQRKKAMAEEIFALLGFAASHNGDRIGSVIFSDIIEHISVAHRGERYFLSQLKTALTIKPAGKGSNMRLALRSADEIMKRRGICVIISDFKVDNYWRELSMLSRRHDVIAIRLEDELDTSFPQVGFLTLGDPEDGATVSVYPKSKAFQREYKGYWNMMRSSWRKKCHQRGVDTLIIANKEDPTVALLTFFKQRGGRH